MLDRCSAWGQIHYHFCNLKNTFNEWMNVIHYISISIKECILSMHKQRKLRLHCCHVATVKSRIHGLNTSAYSFTSDNCKAALGDFVLPPFYKTVWGLNRYNIGLFLQNTIYCIEVVRRDNHCMVHPLLLSNCALEDKWKWTSEQTLANFQNVY